MTTFTCPKCQSEITDPDAWARPFAICVACYVEQKKAAQTLPAWTPLMVTCPDCGKQYKSCDEGLHFLDCVSE